MKNKKHIMVFNVIRSAKSRSDDTLLTVDAIYGQKGDDGLSKSRSDGTLLYLNVVAARLLRSVRCSAVRRLKPPVNKVLSLRDISSLIQHCYKLIISHPLEV